MANFFSTVPIPGSDHMKIDGEKNIGYVPLNEVIKFSIYLRADPESKLNGDQVHKISGTDLFNIFMPSPMSDDDFDQVMNFAEQYSLKWLPLEPGSDGGKARLEKEMKKIRFSASVGNINQAFRIKLTDKSSDGGDFRSYRGSLKIPIELSGIIRSVFGLDTSPTNGSHHPLKFEKIDRKAFHSDILKNLKQELESLISSGDSNASPEELKKLFSDFEKIVKAPETKRTDQGLSYVLSELRELFPKSAHELYHSPFLQKKLLNQGIPFKYSHTVNEIVEMYKFPKKFDGEGETIGIISLYGGWLEKDIQAFCYDMNIDMPTIVEYHVEGGRNRMSDKNETYNIENTLDICVAIAAAPKAKIVVYCAEGGSGDTFYESFIHAVKTAVYDKVNNPGVVSISWSDTELNWKLNHIKEMNQVFLNGSKKGITFCASSGNYGAKGSNNLLSKKPEVRFPSSCPYVLACSGTTLLSTTNGQDSKGKSLILDERVFNDPTYILDNQPSPMASGGGFSRIFKRPYWQLDENLPESLNQGKTGPMRAVPDVTANASMLTGYPLYYKGELYPVPIGGTSSSAPLWAGLLTRINQARRIRGNELLASGVIKAPDEKNGQLINFNLGLVHPRLYKGLEIKKKGGFGDITIGHNRYPSQVWFEKYNARPGLWDGCTGLGPPVGGTLLELLMEDLNYYKTPGEVAAVQKFLFEKGVENLGEKMRNTKALMLEYISADENPGFTDEDHKEHKSFLSEVKTVLETNPDTPRIALKKAGLDMEKFQSTMEKIEALYVDWKPGENPDQSPKSLEESSKEILRAEEIARFAIKELDDYIKAKVFLRLHNPDDDVIQTAYAMKIINRYALISLGVGLIPLPLVDLAAIFILQNKMVKELCELYELKFLPDLGKSVIGSLIGSVSIVGIGLPLVSSVAKIIPGIGSIIGAGSLSISAGVTTFALGKVFMTHFAYGGTFLEFNPSLAQKQFEKEKEKGKSWITSLSASMSGKEAIK